MKAVRINGEEAGINDQGLSNMGELIELVKTTMDPDHIITSLLLDGKEFGDEDWVGVLGRYETSILEVTTGDPKAYVAERIKLTGGVVKDIHVEFEGTRKLFQDGKMQEGNQRLGESVSALKAFFEWYSTMIDLIPEAEKGPFLMEGKTEKLMETLKKICQQQLYQSWWALGETIKDELEGELTELETFLRQLPQ